MDAEDHHRKRRLHIPLSTPVKQSLVLFGLVGSFLIRIVPQAFQSVDTPSLALFFVAGTALITLTAILLRCLGKLGLNLPASALTACLGFNMLIIVIKFILSPAALYAANQRSAFSDEFGSPNTLLFIIPAALAVLLLYVGTFYYLYRSSRRRVRAELALPLHRHQRKRALALPLILLLFVLAVVLTGGVILLLALLVFSSSVSYLGYIFGSAGVSLVVSIALATYLARRSLRSVEQQAIATRDASLLASFFWFGVCLVALYHIMWIVFMLTLVHIWPFKTYSPK